MSRYSAQVPNAHEAYTPHDTDNLFPTGTVAIKLDVTVAGDIPIEDQFGTVVTQGFAVGTHIYPLARPKRIKTTGSTATFDAAALYTAAEG